MRSSLMEQLARHPAAQRYLREQQQRAEPPVYDPAPSYVPPAPAPPAQAPGPFDEALRAIGALNDRFDAAERRDRGRARLQSQGWHTDGIASLESFMASSGISDYAQAAAEFERRQPPPEPLMSGGAAHFGAPPPPRPAPDIRLLLDGREDEFLGPAIANALAEARGGY